MRDRYEGCLLGLALGDALGARHEGGFAARSMWWLLGLGRPGVLRWTDDTQMAAVLAEALGRDSKVDQDALALRWAREARWARGYGPGALKVLRRIRGGMPWREAAVSAFPDGSYGNGAAMRVAPVGLVFQEAAPRRAAARDTAIITHAHPHGVEGAVLMAEATWMAAYGVVSLPALAEACTEDAFLERLRRAETLLTSAPDPRRVRRDLGHDMTALGSVVTAIYVYLAFRDGAFMDLVDFATRLGGDTDTIAAMAGAMYGAARGVGELPDEALDVLEDGPRLRALAARLYAAWPSRL